MPLQTIQDNYINSQPPQQQQLFTHTHNRFTTLSPGNRTSGLMVQGKINRGRHTDHLAGRLSIWTNQCPPPQSSHFLQAGCPSCCPSNSVKALKAKNIHIIDGLMQEQLKEQCDTCGNVVQSIHIIQEK